MSYNKKQLGIVIISSLLIAYFLLSGVSSLLSGSDSQRNATCLLKIEGSCISRDMLHGNNTSEAITIIAMLKWIENKLHFDLSDTLIAKAITYNQQFRINGKFSRNKLDQFLNESDISLESYSNFIKNKIIASVMEPIFSMPVENKAFLSSMWSNINTKHDANITYIDIAKMPMTKEATHITQAKLHDIIKRSYDVQSPKKIRQLKLKYFKISDIIPDRSDIKESDIRQTISSIIEQKTVIKIIKFEFLTEDDAKAAKNTLSRATDKQGAIQSFMKNLTSKNSIQFHNISVANAPDYIRLAKQNDIIGPVKDVNKYVIFFIQKRIIPEPTKEDRESISYNMKHNCEARYEFLRSLEAASPKKITDIEDANKYINNLIWNDITDNIPVYKSVFDNIDAINSIKDFKAPYYNFFTAIHESKPSDIRYIKDNGCDFIIFQADSTKITDNDVSEIMSAQLLKHDSALNASNHLIAKLHKGEKVDNKEGYISQSNIKFSIIEQSDDFIISKLSSYTKEGKLIFGPIIHKNKVIFGKIDKRVSPYNMIVSEKFINYSKGIRSKEMYGNFVKYILSNVKISH